MICGQRVECTTDKGEKLKGIIVCLGCTYGPWAIVQMDDGTFRSFGLERVRIIQ